MKKADAVAWFKENLPTGRYDYWTIQEWWSNYVDNLCRNREITEKQYMAWTTPFKYGKTLIVTNEKKVRYV